MPRATGRPVALLPSGGSVMACRKTMRIKDVRQGLHTLVHTQGLDGLLHLYQRLEKRGRALLLCLLCAEGGWLVLVNAWLRLERAYLKLRLFLRRGSKLSTRASGLSLQTVGTLRVTACGGCTIAMCGYDFREGQVQ